MAAIEKAKIASTDLRAAHIMLCNELDGFVCSGRSKDKKQTYALLEERVPKTKPLSRDESLAALAGKYFASHCPATIYDFSWWSGLSVTDARKAVEMIKPGYVSEKTGHLTYWFTNSFTFLNSQPGSAFLLPAYDEFIISYRNRDAAISMSGHKRAISGNGVFRPILVLNGHVAGIWKRLNKKDKTVLEMQLFSKPNKQNLKLIEKAVIPFASYINQKTELAIT
jgi:hypothetical protein